MNQPNIRQFLGLQHNISNFLESVQIEARLCDLVCELRVEQIFLNTGKSNIEVVYTFPLPYGAVLLDLVAKIGDRQLRGVITPKKIAEKCYEAAICEGDKVIMLEKSDAGICTINLGNLLPGERASLSYQYSYLLAWRQDTVTFRLPTTLAPRFGDPISAGYQPHQVPFADILAENRFSLKLTIEGLLSNALADSPSHPVNVLRQTGITEIMLSRQQAFMDRDFVLNLRQASINKSAGQLQWDDISKSYVALASFCPVIPDAEIPSLCVKILVDCSGSMAGDAMHQTRVGLLRILDNLRDTDTFNVVRFGNQQEAYFSSCLPAAGRNLSYARETVEQLSADMGGTEMGTALDYTYALTDEGERPAAILLVTDGQINDHRAVIRRAIKSGHRVFTLGLGVAVAEEFIRDIADKTGGACELVTPNEGMAEAIYRQFRRMLQASAVAVDIVWPDKVFWQTPNQLPPLFAGDTLHVFAGLGVQDQCEVKLVVRFADGQEISQSLALQGPDPQYSALPRLAAAQRIEDLSLDASSLAEQLADDYQLLTKYTNFLILAASLEAEKARNLPLLVQIPHMLAAGWGGTGSVGDIALLACFEPCINLADMGFGKRLYPSALPVAGSVAEPKGKLDTLFSNFAGSDQTKLDKLLILTQVSAAGGQWLLEFMTKLLPTFPVYLQEIIQDMIRLDGWLESQVIAAILFIIADEIGAEFDYACLQAEFENVKKYPELIEYCRWILTCNSPDDLIRIKP